MNDYKHDKVVKWFYDHEELLIAIINKTPYQSDGWDYEIEVVNEFLTTEQRCYCGDIYTLGVIHRDDGPCHYPDHKDPEQEPDGYVQKVIDALYENSDPVSVEAAELLERMTQPEQDGQCKRCTDGCPACDARRLPEQEPVTMKFKIYKPTAPDPVRQGINNALLPWVYDQDRSSGFDATMWVTPVATLPPQRTWVGLTDEELPALAGDNGKYMELQQVRRFYKYVEAKLKEKNT